MHVPIGARPAGRPPIRAVTAGALASLLVLVVAGTALAHEEREVAGYAVEVGFVGEPVYVGQRTGLEVIVNKDDKPVSGLDKTLKAEVIFGDAKRDLPLTESEDAPGHYTSVFIPTVAGKYTFHLTGSLEGSPVDESFTSSPTGFDEVQEAAAGQFPVTLPTTAELADQAKKGADAAGQVQLALVLGTAGLVAGLLGIGIALAGRRRPAA